MVDSRRIAAWEDVYEVEMTSCLLTFESRSRDAWD